MQYMVRLFTAVPTALREKPHEIKTYVPILDLQEGREFIDMINTMCGARRADLVIRCMFGDRPSYLTIDEFKHVAIEIEHMVHEFERGEKIRGKGKKETDWDQEGTEDFPVEPARS